MKKQILIFICLLITIKTTAQANDSEALLYNVCISGVFASIGSIINKDPNEKINKVILKGFAQGSLGGIVTFGSKCLLRENERQQNLNYSLAAKIINATGTSIIENAAMNKNFWEKWHINIGFNRFEFETKNQFKINYKFMPISFVYITDAFFRYDKFEFDTSLKTGEFIFSTKNLYYNRGATLAGYIVLQNKFIQDPQIITHETIHIYQSNTFSVLNTYFQKPLNKISAKNKTINFLNKHFYFDLHYLPLRLSYISQNKSSNYYVNFFEHEAGYYSSTLY
jgi:hypothetical protein